MSSEIGFTSTIPVEILLAAGKTPVDLNNLFISQDRPLALVEEAELAGFPASSCAWTKGVYAAAQRKGVRTVVAVIQGDCGNSRVLMELWKLAGIRVLPFAYPPDRDRSFLSRQMERLMDQLGTCWEEVEARRVELSPLRQKLSLLDELTWKTNQVDGYHNHLFLLRSTDLGGDCRRFEEEIELYLSQLPPTHTTPPEEVRLGYIGVPSILTGLYQYLESLKARVVFNEVQRQFSIPAADSGLLEGYLRYTYPYGALERVGDIQQEIHRRGIQGLIHYVQSFCFRHLEDMIFRRCLGVPILTVEGDKPGEVDMRTRTRLEAFVELLRGREKGGGCLRG